MAGLLLGCATPSARLPGGGDGSLAAEVLEIETQKGQQLLAMRARLFNVANRIDAANAGFCKGRTRTDIGLDAVRAAELSDPQRAALRRRFKGLELREGDGAVIVAVAKGSPAARAGVRSGDVLLDVPSDLFKGREDGAVGLAGFAPSKLAIRRAGSVRSVNLTPRRVCAYGAKLALGSTLNAYADGENIIMTGAMMALASSDDELAVVYGHELAHNVMRHIDAKAENLAVGAIAGGVLDVAAAVAGVNTGGEFSRLGANVGAGAYSQSFESEADYVGGYLMARAGYDLSKGPIFWAKMAAATGGRVKETAAFGATHPSHPERAAVLRKTLAEIRAKRAAGRPLAPNLDKEIPDPRARAKQREAAAQRRRERRRSLD